MAKNAYIIGKLPGYNSRTDSADRKYAEKLLHNITKVHFTPTGWGIDFVSMFATGGNNGLYHIGPVSKGTGIRDTSIGKSIISGTESFLTPTIEKPPVGVEESPEDKIARETRNKEATSGYINGATEALRKTINGDYFKQTANATTLWKSLIKANVNSIDANEGFTVLGTNDSTFTEVLSNNYRENSISSNIKKITPDILINSIQTINSLHSMTGSDNARGPLNITGGNDLVAMLMGGALGIQTSIPKEWDTSAYNSNLQLMIKLMSPSGHPDDVKKYVLDPLLVLLCAASPVTYHGVLYGHPPLWKIEAEGLQTINVGAITTMSITRGGNETQFNYKNQPLNIDVRLSVESIIPGFAAATNATLYEGQSKTGTGNRTILATNPKDIKDSFGSGQMQKLTIKL